MYVTVMKYVTSLLYVLVACPMYVISLRYKTVKPMHYKVNTTTRNQNIVNCKTTTKQLWQYTCTYS